MIKSKSREPSLHRHQSGFTLIEMMVAIAVVAIAAIAVFQSNSNALRIQATLEQVTMGHWILMDQIAKHHLDKILDDPMQKKKSDSRVYQAGQEYEVNIDTLQLEAGYIEMLEFSVYLVEEGRVQERPLNSAFTFQPIEKQL
ncbi:MAG: prepilin-type N-terminal cleavage/methylation domain-containing protein [Gammaproteobacteria bacterium]|nr:prepilin-type N-terminal cleavage/methylation domain-containing protein [Gammaproteobacteria bacterium]